MDFVQRDDLTKLVEEEINGIRNTICPVQPPVIDTTINPLEITECPRKLVYKSMGYISSKKDSCIQSVIQNLTIKKWQNWFISCKCKNIMHITLPGPFADCHYNITGKIDAILKINDDFIVTKIHGVYGNVYSKIIKKGALKKHVIEVLVYMWLAEKTDGLLIYENIDNGEYRFFHIKPYRPIIDSVREKCLKILDHKIKGELPERPYRDFKSEECKNCGFLQRCTDNEKKK